MYVSDITYDETFYSSAVFDFYFGNANINVIDIETTGLDPARTKIILAGILTPTVNGTRSRQFFAEGAHEEAELLDLYADALSGADILISYNGDRFDIPFAKTRLARHHRSSAFNGVMSFDIYNVIRNFSHLKKILPDLKQKTVEDYMGLQRKRADRISGADSVRLYYEYMASKSEKLMEYILLHNRDDIRQLARLLAIIDRLDLHRIAANMGFPVRLGGRTAFVNSISLQKNLLVFSGFHKNISRRSAKQLRYDDNFRVSFDEGGFCIKVPCLHENGLVFVDLRELDMDVGPLEVYPEYGSGYLLLKDETGVRYGPVNHLIRLIIEKILAEYTFEQ